MTLLNWIQSTIRLSLREDKVVVLNDLDVRMIYKNLNENYDLIIINDIDKICVMFSYNIKKARIDGYAISPLYPAKLSQNSDVVDTVQHDRALLDYLRQNEELSDEDLRVLSNIRSYHENVS